jgi:hypothetical protein
MMIRWNDDAFRAHVARLAAGRGRTPAGICRSAGMTQTWLDRPPSTGRSIEGLLRITNVLDVDLFELLGPAIEKRK